MKDLMNIMPHHRAESKLERWKTLSVINELGEMKHCNKAMYFEGRHKKDLYMWLSSLPGGPSAKFSIENISTMSELKLSGNCLKGARPLLSFDNQFSKLPYLMLLREIITQIFGVPNYHPKSQPFVDRIYSFTFLDNRIWFRNYQILAEDGALAEIGPRFVMNPIKIFADSFSGEALWDNPNYVTPAKHRRMIRTAARDTYVNRTEAKARYNSTQPTEAFNLDKIGHEVFADNEEEMAEKLVAKEAEEEDESMEEDEELNEELRQKRDIERVKKLIEQLKPGSENKIVVKKATKTITKKPVSKKSKMIQNIVKTKQLKMRMKKNKKPE